MFNILLQLLLAINSPSVTVDELAKIASTNPTIELANTIQKDFVKPISSKEQLLNLHKSFESNALLQAGKSFEKVPETPETKVNESKNVVTTSNKTLRQAFIHNGVTYQTSGFVSLPNTKWETDTSYVQSIIDSGQIGIGFNKIALDGRPTMVLGHNPGVFSRIANTIRHGDIIQAYDDNGLEIKYQVNRIFVQDGRPQTGDTTITNPALEDYILGNIYTREDFVIQYCIGTTIHIVQCTLV